MEGKRLAPKGAQKNTSGNPGTSASRGGKRTATRDGKGMDPGRAQRTVPDSEKPASNVDGITPDEGKILPGEEETASEAEKIVSGEEVTAPEAGETVSGEDVTAPEAEETVSGEEETAPEEEKTAPEEEKSASGEENEQVPEAGSVSAAEGKRLPAPDVRREERRRRNREKAARRDQTLIGMLLTPVILIVFAVIIVWNIAAGDKTYSESENRMLAQMPELTWDSFTSGEFMSDMEEYMSDQFMLRDSWTSLDLAFDVALGLRESNGVYIGKENYLFEIPDEPNWEALDRNLEAIRDFSEGNRTINTVMALVPNAACVLDQYLPANAPVRDQAADIKYVEDALDGSLDFVSLLDTLDAHENEYIYYKTDHHWTTLGALYAFEDLADHLRIGAPVSDYDVYPVSDSFSGTLASSSGYHAAVDEIDIYVPKDTETDYVVTYVNEGEKSPSVYVGSALEQKNQYEVFFGGNYARVDINTTLESDTERNLLILKDSYANCLIPFLIPYYNNIYIVDPRYYYDDLGQLIQSGEITDTLFLYNVDTFMTDNSIADVLEDAY